MLLAACGGAPAAQAPTSPPVSTGATSEITRPIPTDVPVVAPTETALSGQLIVFAAASLTDAFEAVATAFAAENPGVEVVYNFANSQQLATQIGEGAPADVFASANIAQMNAALASTRVISGSERTFVRNRLVVITPADNPAAIAMLQDLARPGVKLILADAVVPVGQYSLEFLAKASLLPEYTENFSPTVLANVVSFENTVRSVLTKIVLGEGDAGIVYSTDAALDADSVLQITIPDELNAIANYPIAPLADSANPALAQAFVDYVLAPEGQQILEQYGFIVNP
ncbi:MAG: molybdate ABC transporter substrate-binding protein [Candidatus Viridilinea halotolerans]|uniref:Molybdate ABC transporter substrate-binding protein n=1 Tax=Candidatus Viridilinea halotolerans TaxID=2491704 RepID=A0A426TSX9_9CHLR|nr:MAG: molybdate ABC transporter substrate-binding protein [Candidatus Viridilinea halotolerans]